LLNVKNAVKEFKERLWNNCSSTSCTNIAKKIPRTVPL